MSLRSSLNPRRIPSHFRFQFDIEIDFNDAQLLLRHPESLTSNDYVNIALAYMETGDKEKTGKFAEQALEIENQKEETEKNYETIATANYILATLSREIDNIPKAKQLIKEALSQTWDLWLTTNLYRCLGITYLKEKKFDLAIAEFHKATVLVIEDKYHDLQGSLPALKNYGALAFAKSVLAKNKLLVEDVQAVLRAFKEVTAIYEKMFSEQKISAINQLKSHDFQSHQFHRGMVLCELAEKCVEQKIEFDASQKEAALSLLLAAHEGRIANKADDQRLADVCKWIARVYKLLGASQKEKEYTEKADHHFQRHQEISIKAKVTQQLESNNNNNQTQNSLSNNKQEKFLDNLKGSNNFLYQNLEDVTRRQKEEKEEKEKKSNVVARTERANSI